MSCVPELYDRDILVRFSSILNSRLSATDHDQSFDDIPIADRLPEESEEDSELGTFGEQFTDAYLIFFVFSMMDKYRQEGQFWKLTLWFQQLEADDQRKLLHQLEKLDPLTPGNVHIPRPGDDDTKFRIDRFTELPAGANFPLSHSDSSAIKVVSRRSCIPQQDFASAAQLLSRLSTFGFSLLSPSDRKEVAEISQLYDRYSDRAEGEVTMKSFTELYNAASFTFADRVFLCNTITETFFSERRTCEFIFCYRQLGTKDQEELIDELFEFSTLSDKFRIEKFSEESEEDFRDRRFINLCVPHFRQFYLMRQLVDGAGKLDLRDLHKKSRYAKFLDGFSNIWAKARCPDDSRNLIHVILDQNEGDDIEKLPQGDDIEKIPDESMEDFRVRRFTESFNRFPFSSQQYIVDFIQDTVFSDVGIPLPRMRGTRGSSIQVMQPTNDCCGRPSSPPVLELIKFKAPNLRGGVVPPTSQEGSEVVIHLALDFERSMG